MSISTALAPQSRSIASRVTISITTFVLGLIILFGVGFAQGENGVIHNAAHDTRHAMVFPCH